MKKTILMLEHILLCCLIILNVSLYMQLNSKKKNSNENNDLYNNTLEAYRNLLENKTEAIDKKGNYINLNQIVTSEKMSEKNYQYALFDSNKDNIPELHIKAKNHYNIVSYRNDNLYIWAELTPYYNLLNNGAFLHIRMGGTPYHINYIYTIFDSNGDETINMYFDKYDDNEDSNYDESDSYYFNSVKVSKDDWDTLTKDYFSIGSNEINWYNYSENDIYF